MDLVGFSFLCILTVLLEIITACFPHGCYCVGIVTVTSNINIKLIRSHSLTNRISQSYGEIKPGIPMVNRTCSHLIKKYLHVLHSRKIEIER